MPARPGVPASRWLPVLAAVLLCAGCGASAPGLVYTGGPGSVTGDGLHRVRWSQMGAEFVRPGARLGGYDRVLIDPLTIAPAPEGEKRRMGPTRQYAPTPDYLDGMRRIYQESFVRQFDRGGFSVVSEPGPGVLRISGHVADLVLTARLDPEGQTTTREFVRGFGELTLLLEVRDSVSGETLLRTVDRQPIARDPVAGAAVNSTGANLSAQRLLFANQALLLHQRLAELRAMGTSPETPPAGAAPVVGRRQPRPK